MRAVRIIALACSVLLVGCAGRHPLAKEHAAALIEASPSWSEPVEASLNIDPSFRPTPGTKRELLKIEAVALKDDGPGGIAGQTATVAFTWRWVDGYLQAKTFRSRAKLNDSGEGWKVYDDTLRDSLGAAERSNID